MPWIESHSVLFRHRKVKDLSRALNIDPVQAIGHLHCLWHTAIEQAEDGDLSSWSAGAIADAAQWKGSEQEFLQAVFSSGFMDKGQLLHDWLDYAGKYLTSKYKTSNPDRLKEIWSKFGKFYGKEVNRNSYPLPLGVPPNLTLPNQTEQKQENIGRASRFIPPTFEEVQKYCLERKNSVDPETFIAHYESNGWKVGKNPMKSWKSSIITWEKNERNFGNGTAKQRADAGAVSRLRGGMENLVQGGNRQALPSVR